MRHRSEPATTGRRRPIPVSAAAHLACTDRHGVEWHVWDILDGRRVPPGEHVVERRLFVRVSDGWAYACPVNPRAGPSPTDTHYLWWQIDGALADGPLRRKHESDAEYAARQHAHRVAYHAQARAYQQRLWDETARRS